MTRREFLKAKDVVLIFTCCMKKRQINNRIIKNRKKEVIREYVNESGGD